MIEGNDRLVIILGMAHSGTTILTYILQQHPQIICCKDGSEEWIFENTWLPLEQADHIQQALQLQQNRRVILKRPFNEVWHADWMAREMPAAKYIYCLRSFEEISKSWIKPDSFVDARLKTCSQEERQEFYQAYFDRAMVFKSTVPYFKMVKHSDLLKRPKKIFEEIGSWIGILNWNWDVSQVSADINIKDILRQKQANKVLTIRHAKPKT